MSSSQPFASQLADALAVANLNIDQIADRTKIARSSLKALLGDTGAAALPPRVYLRGHVRLLARELGMDERAALASFDKSYPESAPAEETSVARTSPAMAVAVAAGLGGIAILTIVVAFSR